MRKEVISSSTEYREHIASPEMKLSPSTSSVMREAMDITEQPSKIEYTEPTTNIHIISFLNCQQSALRIEGGFLS